MCVTIILLSIKEKIKDFFSAVKLIFIAILAGVCYNFLFIKLYNIWRIHEKDCCRHI